MIKFSDFLLESTDIIELIKDKMKTMSADEIDEFGEYLYDDYFEYDEIEDYEQENTEDIEEEPIDVDEVLYILSFFSRYELKYVLDMLEDDDFIDEAVSVRMKASNVNKNKKKFMKKSSSQMRKEQAQRKASNKKNKQKRKQYYKKNKSKIQRYQADYNKKVKSGQHKKKVRKRA
jgi:hypothetical protein